MTPPGVMEIGLGVCAFAGLLTLASVLAALSGRTRLGSGLFSWAFMIAVTGATVACWANMLGDLDRIARVFGGADLARFQTLFADLKQWTLGAAAGPLLFALSMPRLLADTRARPAPLREQAA